MPSFSPPRWTGPSWSWRPASTKKGAARRAVQLLSQARATVLGAAYNKMRVQDGEYYYYNYRYGTPALIKEPVAPAVPLLTAASDHDPQEKDHE